MKLFLPHFCVLSMAPPKPSLNLIVPMAITFFLSIFCNQVSSISDSISLNQSLSGTQKLTSEGGNFVLGFFQPGNSSFYFLGIWYKKISQLTPVWVANRNSPITDPLTAELKISSDGNLVLGNKSNPHIWSTDTNITSTSTLAVLLDTGNFVLKDASNASKTLWQSFDHPTDTWLPGGKLGENEVTGEIQRMNSWKSLDDPATGIYYLGIDPKGSSQFFISWNNSVNYWTSGTWNGDIFAAVPEMMAHYLFSFQYVSSDIERYFTYDIQSKSIITRFILDISGQIKMLTWVEASEEWTLFWSQPKQQCQVYALCGPNGSCNENAYPYCQCIEGFRKRSPANWASSDRTGGCVRDTDLQCGKNSSAEMKKDRFLAMSDMRFPANAQILEARNALDCELACLNNCSCNAYSYSRSGCSIWHGDLLNLQEQYKGPGGGTLLLRLAASELSNSKSKNQVLFKALIGGIAGTLFLFSIIGLLIWRRKRKTTMGKLKVVEGGLVAFRYSDLQRVSKNFSEKLGGGSFGSVFKGVLADSTLVAVKKLEGFRQGEKQFRAEVSTIGTIQHVNLVRLYGFCTEGKHKLLVYEYMDNGSLDSQLFQKNSNSVLNWKLRYQICLGIARGLTYLHEHCRDCIIHCDIKPENILLDASFIAKVADFGLAKLLGRDLSRVLTTMRGTVGYLAPEWISGAAITAKADVYSYGMMLFEIISGRRNLDPSEAENSGFFPTLAARKLVEGDASGMLDQRLQGNAESEEVIRVCKVACWCIQDDENSRPTMGQVVQILEGLTEVSMPPIPRVLQIFTGNQGTEPFPSESSSSRSPGTSNVSWGSKASTSK